MEETMFARRILSLWFPRLGAERIMRSERGGYDAPLAVVRRHGGMQVISSLNAVASAAGLRRDQPLRGAYAVCPGLVTRPRCAVSEGRFLSMLCRWAGKYSPWVAEELPDGLVLDITGCAHLFGGESALLDGVEVDCAGMGLTVRAGIADTRGAAWAVSRFAGQTAVSNRDGDDIDHEARATRSRAVRRHWTKGGTAPHGRATNAKIPGIVPPGRICAALGPLPVAALRLESETADRLSRLGIRVVRDLLELPRASLARRFGPNLLARLDRATGRSPEPISPVPSPERFAVCLTFPEPIGLVEDVNAAMDRMLTRLCTRLVDLGRGANAFRLEVFRTDRVPGAVTVRLGSATNDRRRIQPLLEMRVESVDAGDGIDALRLEAVGLETDRPSGRCGNRDADRAAETHGCPAWNGSMGTFIDRVGTRLGLDTITCRYPVASHIPEKTAGTRRVTRPGPMHDWPEPVVPRPLLLWRPEPVRAPAGRSPPTRFRWRGRNWSTETVKGPERIAPEWWVDDPAWSNGVRDYWVVTTHEGDRLWLFHAHGAAASSGWFCHGRFA